MDDYDTVTVNENDIEQVHALIDQMDQEDQTLMENIPERPESLGSTMAKYRIQADIPRGKKEYFDSFKSFHGTHVALSNTKRMDNLGHLDAEDLCMIYENIPMLRHRGTQVKIRETGHFQMTRGNEKVGGFEAELAW